MPGPELSVVVPAYNEAGNIEEFLRRLVPILRENVESYEIIFSVDPCTDGTEDIILAARERDPNVKMLRFSRRFGQPTATLAGACCRSPTWRWSIWRNTAQVREQMPKPQNGSR